MQSVHKDYLKMRAKLRLTRHADHKVRFMYFESHYHLLEAMLTIILEQYRIHKQPAILYDLSGGDYPYIRTIRIHNMWILYKNKHYKVSWKLVDYSFNKIFEKTMLNKPIKDNKIDSFIKNLNQL